jgi:hypothetical protein
MVQEIGSQQDTDKHLLDILSVGAVIPIITYNVMQPCDSWLLRWLQVWDSQFCKGAVMCL